MGRSYNGKEFQLNIRNILYYSKFSTEELKGWYCDTGVVRLSPSMQSSHSAALVQALETPLLIQFLVNVPGKAEDGQSAWAPVLTWEIKAKFLAPCFGLAQLS